MSYVLKFPDIGEGLEEGVIIEWHIKLGDFVEKGTPLVNVETDKVTTDITSPVAGKVIATHGEEGDIIKVGDDLVEFETEQDDSTKKEPESKPLENNNSKDSETKSLPKTKEEEIEEEEIEEEEDAATVVGTIEAGSKEILPVSNELIELEKEEREEVLSNAIQATPIARRFAKEHGISLLNVHPTGIGGRIRKEDVIEYAKSLPTFGQAIPIEIPKTPIVRIEYETLSQIRKTIAKNMVVSKQNAAHMSLFDETEISNLMDMRKRYNEKYATPDFKISFLPFIVKATVEALKNNRIMNAELDMNNNRMIYKNYYNIGIAVDTPKGLMVPVIRDADKLSIQEIAQQVIDLSEKARLNKLTLDEMKDGTFTLTNYGTIGGRFGVPIINYPQVAILGIGAIYKKPVVVNNEIVIGNSLPLSVSVDHRIIDGAGVVRFLNDVMNTLSNPVTMLI